MELCEPIFWHLTQMYSMKIVSVVVWIWKIRISDFFLKVSTDYDQDNYFFNLVLFFAKHFYYLI